MTAYIPDEMKHYKKLLESAALTVDEGTIPPQPTNGTSPTVNNSNSSTTPAANTNNANPNENPDNEEQTDEGNEFSGARQAAIDAGQDHFSVAGKQYNVNETEGLAEKSDLDNFTADDIKKLELLGDVDAVKAQAKKLISTPSRKPIKPEKIAWFNRAIDSKNSVKDIVKLMFDLLLSGEGYGVVGTRYSTDSNSYRKSFGESGENGEYSNEDPKPYSPLSGYKRKAVQGLYNYDHFEHPDGSFIQRRHGNGPLELVHQDRDGNRTKYDNYDKLKNHLAKLHPPVDESVTSNQFENPRQPEGSKTANWKKAGTTSQNYSKGQEKSWDSYMSNESNELNVTETSYEKDMDEKKPVFVQGVIGANSKSFKKKFTNQAAADRWIDANSDNIEITHIYNENAALESADDCSQSEQDAWDSKGSNESAEWNKLATEAQQHLSEKWNTDSKTDPKKKGMFSGKTKAELEAAYKKLKASGPHKKDSAENIKMKELAFAIRAKSKWGKVDESVEKSDESAVLDRIRYLSGLK